MHTVAWVGEVKRRYSAEEKAEAVALTRSVGPALASERLGIPRTTLQYWSHQPSSSVIVAQAEANIATRLQSVAALALAEVEEGLRNPRAKLGDKVQALRVISEQLALAEGRATANIETRATYRDGGAADPAVAPLDDDEAEWLQRIVDSLLNLDDKTLALIFDTNAGSGGDDVGPVA